MNKLVKTLSILYYIGMILVLIGIILRLVEHSLAGYVFAIGVAPILAARFYNYEYGKRENKRLNSILLASSLFLAGTVALIIMGRMYWILGLLISAALDFYVSFRKFKN